VFFLLFFHLAFSLSRAERGITTIFDLFFIPKRSEGSLQCSTIFFIPKRSEGSLQSSTIFLSRDALTFVILSGVGAHATTQSKDLCIFFGARKQHVKHRSKSHSENAGTHQVEQAFRPALKLKEKFGFSH
jgi:hypothetical protein